MELYPLKLRPFISETVWGGRRLIDEYSIDTEKSNAAEAWVLSCHKNGKNIIENGALAGTVLADFLRENPRAAGANCPDAESFPVLIKLIDAADDLSVQVHPDDAYCEKKGSGAGKTEAWYILDCEPGAQLLLGFKKEMSREEFKRAIESGTLENHVRRVDVKKGDFFFIDAGTLHAICRGTLLAEVQQNSDTTYRIYDYNRCGLDGKPRELHIEDALNVTELKPYISAFSPKPGKNGRTLLAACPFFTESVIECSGELEGNAGEQSFVSLVVLEGDGRLLYGGESLDIKKGESIFIPAGCGEYKLSGDMRLLETTI